MRPEQLLQFIAEACDYVAKNPGGPAPAKGVLGRHDDAAALLASIHAQMRHYEGSKYTPASHYRYQTLEISGSPVSYVDYNGGVIDESQAETMHAQALSVRKLSLIAGIVNMLNESPDYLTSDEKRRKQLLALLNTVAESINPAAVPREDINVFVENLTTKIKEVIVEDEVNIRNNIRCAERYFVAEYKQAHVHISAIKVNGEDIFMLDIPFGNQLTDDQKREFLRIHAADTGERPAWFNGLPRWEQVWWLKKTPKTMDADWQAFEKLSQSSAMQHVPGLKNARMNYLVRKHAGKFEILSSSFKTSTLVPYEMPKREQKRIAKQNAQQVVDHLRESNPALIYIGSLLSDVYLDRVIGGLDSPLTKIQKEVVREVAATSPVPVIAGNDPVNKFRITTPATGLIAESSGRWEHVDEVLKYYDAHLPQLLGNGLAHEVARQLHLMRQETFAATLNRNFTAHKTAYLSILVEAMGGMVSTNCKSGKDRTGFDELYRAAMKLYYQTDPEHRLPGYADSKADRDRFIGIYVTLFNAFKTQEAAAGNTPGSFGLKDSAQMLCGDIAKELGASYKVSNSNADLNKPVLFYSDEGQALKDQKQADKEQATTAKKITRGLPYLHNLLFDLKVNIYSNRVYIQGDNIKQRLTHVNQLINEWLVQANPEQCSTLMQYKKHGETLRDELALKLSQAPTAIATHKIVYFSDLSEELVAPAGSSLDTVVQEEIKKVPAVDGAMKIEAGVKPQLKFSASTSTDFARKNTSIFQQTEFTTLQHLNQDGKCTSHLMYTDEMLGRLSKNEMILLAIRQVEDFRALSKTGVLRLNGNLAEKNVARFVQVMAEYCDIMKYPAQHDLSVSLSARHQMKRDLDTLTASDEYSSALFQYHKKSQFNLAKVVIKPKPPKGTGTPS